VPEVQLPRSSTTDSGFSLDDSCIDSNGMHMAHGFWVDVASLLYIVPEQMGQEALIRGIVCAFNAVVSLDGPGVRQMHQIAFLH